MDSNINPIINHVQFIVVKNPNPLVGLHCCPAAKIFVIHTQKEIRNPPNHDKHVTDKKYIFTMR